MFFYNPVMRAIWKPSMFIVMALLSACWIPPPIEVDFETAPEILRGTWTAKLEYTCQNKVVEFGWTPDSTRILALNRAPLPATQFWDVATGASSPSALPPLGSGFVFSSDGATIVSSSLNEVRFYSTNTGSLQKTVSLPAAQYGQSMVFNAVLTQVAVVPSAFFRSGTNVKLNLHSLSDGALIRGFDTGFKDYVSALRWSPDGQKLAAVGNTQGGSSGHSDPFVRVWTIDGTLVLDKPIQNETRALEFSPDSLSVAVGGKVVNHYRLSDAVLVNNYGVATDAVSSALSFSPNGQRLAVAQGLYSTQRRTEVWNTVSGTKIWNIDFGQKLAFSPNGSLLAVQDEQQCGLVLVKPDTGATEKTFTTDTPDSRTMTMNLTATYVSQSSYSIAGTVQIQGLADMTVQGTGFAGSGRIYVKPQSSPLPPGASLVFRTQAGQVFWQGTMYLRDGPTYDGGITLNDMRYSFKLQR
jgi:WD40 repeat protein